MAQEFQQITNGVSRQAAITLNSTMTINTFNGDGSTTVFTLTATPVSIATTVVFVSGLYQEKSTYSISANVLTFSQAPPIGTNNIEVNIGSIATANGGAIAPTIQKFTANGSQTGILFGITTATIVKGDTYTNNSQTFTVLNSGSTALLFTSGLGTPTASGTLTRASGTGPSTLTFTAFSILATYTTPANVLYLQVRGIGGGGGGGGSGTSNTGGTGGNGNSTVFGTMLLTTTGGAGGNGVNGSSGGQGGTATIFSPAIGIAVPGNGGSAGNWPQTGTSGTPGGQAGAGAFGGGPISGGTNTPGGNAQGNSGSGGSGGAGTNSGSSSNLITGSGGGAGGFFDAIIQNPQTSYVYCIGSGGTAGTIGTAGTAGGAGAAGFIEVIEYYATGAVGSATTLTGTITSSNVTTSTFIAPTVQKFTTVGTGTYNLPTSPRAPVYIRVRMVGGGGGGGSGTSGATGSAGGQTLFGSSFLVCNGGGGGWGGAGVGGMGGTATITAPAIGIAVQGGQGGPGSYAGTGGTAAAPSGGNGAPTPFGGNGGGSANGASAVPGATTGSIGVANTGSGGGGGGAPSNAISSGGGGGAGGYIDVIIPNPLTSYGIQVASGGAAQGTVSTNPAYAGATGFIIVEEFYQ